MLLKEIVDWLDGQFTEYQVSDYSNNGLQLEACKEVKRIAYAVDVCRESIVGAIAADAQLLIAHHGLSWGTGFDRVTGVTAQRFGLCFMSGLSVYGMHLPLDAHDEIGNNAVLARELGCADCEKFAEINGLKIGVAGRWTGTGAQLAERVHSLTGAYCRVFGDEKREIGKLGIITGAGGGELDSCLAAGVDTLLTGELKHSEYHEAMEHGITVLAGGHYATEIFGVRELAKRAGGKFACETVEISSDSGL